MVVWKLARELGKKKYEIIDVSNKLNTTGIKITKASETVANEKEVREYFANENLPVVDTAKEVEQEEIIADVMISVHKLKNELFANTGVSIDDMDKFMRERDIKPSLHRLKPDENELLCITEKEGDMIEQFCLLRSLTPTQYFDIVKNARQNVTEEALKKVYDNALTLINAYIITGQKKAVRKLAFQIHTIERELDIVKKGFTRFVYRQDIEKYIEKVARNVVKIIELENYERDIPQDIIEKIAETKDIFDKMYVFFTDYTGKEEKKVEKERREKDPILFGAFMNDSEMADRFYFIGDWIDDYCDLTLDKMVESYENKYHEQMTRTISTPEDIEALKLQLGVIDYKDAKYVQRKDGDEGNEE